MSRALASRASTHVVPTSGSRWDRAARYFGRYLIVLFTLGVIVMLFTIERVVLMIGYVDWREMSLWQIMKVFLTGLRFDLLIGLALLVPQILHMTLHTNRSVTGRLSRISTHTGLIITFGMVIFLCASEVLFFDEFSSRFNYIAFEYLAYPTEVLSNLQQSYPLLPIVAGIAVGAILLYLPMRRRTTPLLFVQLPAVRRYGFFGATLALIAALAATTTMTSTQLGDDRLANECAGNAVYSFGYYAWTNRFDYEPFYLTGNLTEGFDRVARRVVGPGEHRHTGSSNPLDRTIDTGRPRRDYNVVLILEESFGSDFVGVLGDKRGLSPRLDALSRKGILFDNFFATGNRTARAIEATLTSLPPIPTESILKRDHSDRVYTMANILAERGYQRMFVYGGRGLFDGMRSFTLANGFERFIEQSDYENPRFTNAWGVCDEDIFDKALYTFDMAALRDKPFFGVVLTVSNHQPFTYPDGRISEPSSAQRRVNAIKYADHALGRFFDMAKDHPFHANTIYIVMGDHGARVYGAQMFPIKSYRIPVLMILPHGEQAGTRCSTLASSLDIAPTIMGRLGGSYRSVFYGRNVLGIEPSSAYALMQHNHSLALLRADDTMTVLSCPKKVRSYRLDRATFGLKPVDDSKRDVDDVIAFFQTANRLYYDEKYFPDEKMPEFKPPTDLTRKAK